MYIYRVSQKFSSFDYNIYHRTCTRYKICFFIYHEKNFNKSSTHFFRDTILFLDLFVTHKRIVAIATIVTELPIVPFLTCFFFCEGKCRSKFPKFLGHPVCVFRGGRSTNRCNRSRYSTLVTTPFNLGMEVREFPSGFGELISKLSLSLRIFDNDRI